MKSKLPYLLLALGAGGALMLSQPTSAPAQGADETAVAALVAELVTQQGVLQQNQAKVDEKLAVIAEDIRQARLFAARAGGKR